MLAHSMIAASTFVTAAPELPRNVIGTTAPFVEDPTPIRAIVSAKEAPIGAVQMTEDGSVQLPADLRARLGFRGGQRFDTVTRGKVVLLVPVVDASGLRGSARGVPTEDYRDDEG